MSESGSVRAHPPHALRALPAAPERRPLQVHALAPCGGTRSRATREAKFSLPSDYLRPTPDGIRTRRRSPAKAPRTRSPRPNGPRTTARAPRSSPTRARTTPDPSHGRVESAARRVRALAGRSRLGPRRVRLDLRSSPTRRRSASSACHAGTDAAVTDPHAASALRDSPPPRATAHALSPAPPGLRALAVHDRASTGSLRIWPLPRAKSRFVIFDHEPLIYTVSRGLAPPSKPPVSSLPLHAFGNRAAHDVMRMALENRAPSFRRALYFGVWIWHCELQLGVPSHCSPNCDSTRPSPQYGANVHAVVHTPDP